MPKVPKVASLASATGGRRAKSAFKRSILSCFLGVSVVVVGFVASAIFTLLPEGRATFRFLDVARLAPPNSLLKDILAIVVVLSFVSMSNSVKHFIENGVYVSKNRYYYFCGIFIPFAVLIFFLMSAFEMWYNLRSTSTDQLTDEIVLMSRIVTYFGLALIASMEGFLAYHAECSR